MVVDPIEEAAIYSMLPHEIERDRYIPLYSFFRGPIRPFSKYVLSNRAVCVALNLKDGYGFESNLTIDLIKPEKDVTIFNVLISDKRFKEILMYLNWDSKIFSIRKAGIPSPIIFEFKFDTYECYRFEAL